MEDQQQQRNLQIGYKILSRIPEEAFTFELESFYSDLEYVTSVPPNIDAAIKCGTVACAAGWLALDKHFRDESILADSLLGGSYRVDWRGWASRHFGSGSFKELFEYAGGTHFDRELICGPDGDEDNALEDIREKAIAMYRFRRALGDNPRTARERVQQDTRWYRV